MMFRRAIQEFVALSAIKMFCEKLRTEGISEVQLFDIAYFSFLLLIRCGLSILRRPNGLGIKNIFHSSYMITTEASRYSLESLSMRVGEYLSIIDCSIEISGAFPVKQEHATIQM